MGNEERGSHYQPPCYELKGSGMKIGFSKSGKIHGVGYCSTELRACEGGSKATKCYRVWEHMLERCYSDKKSRTQRWYKDKGVTVCKEWHDYSNFHKWYKENTYELGSDKLQIDKDIMFEGNKEYSPTKCILVPQSVNTLLIDREADRGIYKKGVYKDGERFKAQVSVMGKVFSLGRFKTETEASNEYERAKKEVIRFSAEMNKNRVPAKLYERLLELAV